MPDVPPDLNEAVLKVAVFDPEPHRFADPHSSQSHQLGHHSRGLREPANDGQYLVDTWDAGDRVALTQEQRAGFASGGSEKLKRLPLHALSAAYWSKSTSRARS